MDGTGYFIGSAIPSLPSHLDLPFPADESFNALDFLPSAPAVPPEEVAPVRANLSDEVSEQFTDDDIARILANHPSPGDSATLLTALSDFSFGPEIWANDLSSKVALLGGRSKQGALCVILRAGSYVIGPATKPAVVLAGETILSYVDEQLAKQDDGTEKKLNGKLLPIVDFRGFYPTLSHLPLAVWLLGSVVGAYSERVEKLLVFGTGYFLSTLWYSLKAVVPSSSTELVAFVDETSIWDYVDRDGFFVEPLHRILTERAQKEIMAEEGEESGDGGAEVANKDGQDPLVSSSTQTQETLDEID